MLFLEFSTAVHSLDPGILNSGPENTECGPEVFDEQPDSRDVFQVLVRETTL